MLFNQKSTIVDYLVAMGIVYYVIKHSKNFIEVKNNLLQGPIIIHGHMDGLSLEVQ
jgi:hypothetical protein